jgi:hypothetical protein
MIWVARGRFSAVQSSPVIFHLNGLLTFALAGALLSPFQIYMAFATGLEA